MIKRAAIYFGGFALVAMLVVKGCEGPEPIDVRELPASTNLHVAIKDRVITVRTHDGVVSGYVSEKGRADVIVTDDGIVDLRVKSAGLTLQPVIGAFVSRGPSLAVGAQVAYWKRGELYVGAAYPLAGWVGLGYRLDALFLSNTSIFANYTTRQEPGIGLLVRF